MECRRLSPSTTEEAEFLYAVFDSYDCERKADDYFVYKRDHSSGASASAAAVGDDSLPDLGEPIWSSDSGVKLASDMIVFSWRSSIYFVGGYTTDTGAFQPQRDAFRLDLHKLNSSSGTRIDPVPIASMNSSKPSPWTFGPIEGHFYIFSDSVDCSFESFDPVKEKWVSLSLPASNPDIKEYLNLCNNGLNLSFRIRAAAVCDSNIYLTPTSWGPLFVFFTECKTWGLIPRQTRCGRLSLPYDGKAVTLTVGNEKNLIINKPNTGISCSVYKCPYLPVNENCNMAQIDLADDHAVLEPFGVEGEVGGLEDRLQQLNCYGERVAIPQMLFWSFDNKAARICIVPCDHRGRPRKMRCSLIHICNLTLVEGEEFKVAVTSIVTYKHRADRSMMPRHFLFAS